MFDLFKRLLGVRQPKNSGRRQTLYHRRAKPQVERLETRVTPPNLTWLGTTDGNWATATNWSPQVTPANNDTLIFETRHQLRQRGAVGKRPGRFRCRYVGEHGG